MRSNPLPAAPPPPADRPAVEALSEVWLKAKKAFDQEWYATSRPDVCLDKALAVIKHAIRALLGDEGRPAEEAWRPIETAPKDLPERFLIAYSCGHVTEAEYTECLEGGPDDHQTFHPHISPPGASDDPDQDWPTHWMPLPAPPRIPGAPK